MSDKEQENKDLLQLGECIYCGQTYQLETNGAATEEQLNKWATQKCDCEQAMKAQESESIQNYAEDNVEGLFRREFPDTASLLKAAIIPIMANAMDSITIDTGKKVKGKVSKTAKGNIKVERIETKKTVLES